MGFEYEDDIIVTDAGVMFPEEEMLGIDLVIPDITHLVENKDRVKGIFSATAEDHIGAVPYVPRCWIPHLRYEPYIGAFKGKLRNTAWLPPLTCGKSRLAEESKSVP